MNGFLVEFTGFDSIFGSPIEKGKDWPKNHVFIELFAAIQCAKEFSELNGSNKGDINISHCVNGENHFLFTVTTADNDKKAGMLLYTEKNEKSMTIFAEIALDVE